MTYLGVGIFAAVIGYLILSLTNDSCVALSPIFYTLIGIGLGINHKIRKDMEFVFIKKTTPDEKQKLPQKAVLQQRKPPLPKRK